MTTIAPFKVQNFDFGNYGYVSADGGETYFRGCTRCGGTGHYSFNGFDSICYKCGNVAELRLGTFVGDAAAAQKDADRRQRDHDKRLAKKEEKRMIEVRALEAKVAEIPEDVRNFLLSIQLDQYATEEDYYGGTENPRYEKNSFLRSMAEQVQYVTNARRPFTEKMVEAVRKAAAKRLEQAAEAEAHPAPTGRVVVTGEIISAKVKESEFGDSYKILVKDDAGFKVWCSLPAKQREEAHGDFYDLVVSDGYSIGDFGPWCWFLGTDGNGKYDNAGVKGRRITFTATLEPSSDDKSFAFGSRPTKGAWL
jgi:hypothetical protein